MRIVHKYENAVSKTFDVTTVYVTTVDTDTTHSVTERVACKQKYSTTQIPKLF